LTILSHFIGKLRFQGHKDTTFAFLILIVSHLIDSYYTIAYTDYVAPFITMVESETSTPVTKPSTSNSTHLIVFVHGWLGNENELSYLRRSMEQHAAEQKYDNIVYHSAKCNAGKTNDGIEAGGNRLAEELTQVLHEMEGRVFLSLVGNSLGGLYIRHAIAHMGSNDNVTPFLFCTISTPHLGSCEKKQESGAFTKLVGKVGGPTPQDLFLQSSTIQELGTREMYLAPLRTFHRRIALANVYRTDLLVSTRSGAFLSPNGVYTTKSEASRGKKNYALVVESAPRDSGDCDKEDMAGCLDSVGWTKILLDIRDDLPFPAISNPFWKKQPAEPPVPEKKLWTSQELMDTFDRRSPGSSWKIPLGHQVLSVNSKNNLYSRISSGGQPTMDQLGKDLLEMVVHEQQYSSSDSAISISPPEPASSEPESSLPDESLTKESTAISSGVDSMPTSKDSSEEL
jgi:pimeloyl-ACP methyl ester carboxylesterase